MKIETERALIRLHHWASCVMAFGIGYCMLSFLQREMAFMIAWGLVLLGALTKVVADSRLHRLRDAAHGSRHQNT
jgi:4-hydroxybenzoate polyprenyltransferase